ncbi:gb [Venturia nashicola]|uniref:Gb n=1 Tax=Venturia nashicola TaxID=86259 RepID=A0A4Z1PDH8_9PEZI|nr:gb [Venturia nashicola]TLD38758.1 gb [Venturia nashicola]
MVKFYTQSYSYDYPFPTVTLAYFLRYPNPFSTHVLSTDVISKSFDAETQRLHITRLHLKRSKLPSAVLRIVPRSFLGATAQGDSQTYILEHSTVDVKEGWMRTESRNLEWTGVLSVVERQEYNAPLTSARDVFDAKNPGDSTAVKTTVTLHSRLGQQFKKKGEESTGFLRTWSQGATQRAIEAIGLRRAEKKSQPNAREGMKVVLERLRHGGLVEVLEGMRRDRESVLAHTGHGFKMLHDDDDSKKR